MTWIISNLGSIIIALVLAVIVGLVIMKMLKDKKNGKSSCGCGCANCAMKDSCHSNNK